MKMLLGNCLRTRNCRNHRRGNAQPPPARECVSLASGGRARARSGGSAPACAWCGVRARSLRLPATQRPGGSPRPSGRRLGTEEPPVARAPGLLHPPQLQAHVCPSGLPTEVADVAGSVSISLAVDLGHQKGLLLHYKKLEDRCVC